MMRTRVAAAVFAVLALAAAGCGGGSDQPPTDDAAMDEPAAGGAAMQETATPDRQVIIATPADGDTVEGGDVTVRLEARGFTVVPAGDTTPNSGHHHLFLDRDISPGGEPIPAEEGAIVHMGTGVSEYVFQGVEPGEHRLIAVVGDAAHVPLEPLVTDTVHFVVR